MPDRIPLTKISFLLYALRKIDASSINEQVIGIMSPE